jgi:hypothetical protein
MKDNNSMNTRTLNPISTWYLTMSGPDNKIGGVRNIPVDFEYNMTYSNRVRDRQGKLVSAKIEIRFAFAKLTSRRRSANEI